MGSELSRPQDAAPVVAEQAVSVKALCAFGAKAGDLDLRFVPAPSALEGMAGHAMVQHRRDPEHYACEVGLEATCGALRVRGRADGYEARRAGSRKSRPSEATSTPFAATIARCTGHRHQY